MPDNGNDLTAFQHIVAIIRIPDHGTIAEPAAAMIVESHRAMYLVYRFIVAKKFDQFKHITRQNAKGCALLFYIAFRDIGGSLFDSPYITSVQLRLGIGGSAAIAYRRQYKQFACNMRGCVPVATH